MTGAQAAVTTSALRNEIAEAEAEEGRLHEQLKQTRRSTREAHAAGIAVLSAVETAMTPLMVELAALRRDTKNIELAKVLDFPQEEGHSYQIQTLLGPDEENLKSEAQHLQLDITHFQDKAEKIQAGERQRLHEIKRLQNELRDLVDELSYQKQRVNHLCVVEKTRPSKKKQVGTGIHKQVLAEQNLRESAEKRAGKITRELSRLSIDTNNQQSTIEFLGRRLGSVRNSSENQDYRLGKANCVSNHLTACLNGNVQTSTTEGGVDMKVRKPETLKKLKNTASTGRLPHLSF